MSPLLIDHSQDIPEIILDKNTGKFSFSGTSIPENARKFFEPVLSWIHEYIDDPNPETIVLFKMKYFNTASTKSLLDIMVEFKELAKNGHQLIFNWYFPKDDEDMYEAGTGFSKMVRFPFNFIEY